MHPVRPAALAALTVVVAAVAAASALVAHATRAAAPPAFIGPYTGVGTGLLDRYRHLDNQASDPDDHIVTDSTDVYRGRFTYSFRIDSFGNISGTGVGSYQQATWHLSGVNGDQGAFECDVPMTTTGFTVQVTGRASDGEMRIRFALVGAREANEEHYCGANYYGFATDSPRLAESLEFVQPAEGVVAAQARPAIAPLRKLETLGDEFDRRVILHEWEITIVAPATPQDAGGGATPGTAPSPGRAGRGGAICTIDGTARADRLRGTPGNDVICGYGGGDTVDGRGGQDLVYGGLGNDRLTGGAGFDVLYGNAGRDRLTTRDGRPDRLDGGRGRDDALVDRGRDRVRSVERVR